MAEELYLKELRTGLIFDSRADYATEEEWDLSATFGPYSIFVPLAVADLIQRLPRLICPSHE